MLFARPSPGTPRRRLRRPPGNPRVPAAEVFSDRRAARCSELRFRAAAGSAELPGVPRAHYGPRDALRSPRYTGIRTFARCPAVTDWANADVAVIGVPFDTATSYRTGPRFGPAAIREQSQLLRPWHSPLAVDVFAELSVIDGGDVDITPGNAEKTAGQIASGLAPVIEAGSIPIVLGGDHSIVLGELRAHAGRHGPVGVVLLDAHADTWESYYGERYFHGTPFKRALEEGLIDPYRSLLAGMRGPLYAASDLDEPRGWGFEIVTCDELRTWTPEHYASRVRARVVDGPAYSHSTSTCSTHLSPRGPAPPRWPACWHMKP